jgi:hypothetical protein
MPRFALVTVDGNALGTIELGRPDHPEGSTIWRDGESNLRVVGHRDPREDGLPVLVVEKA